MEKSPTLVDLNSFNKIEYENLPDNVISDLVLELFDNIDSKESFNFISNLLISTLIEYKNNLFIENINEYNEKSPNETHNNSISASHYDLNKSKNEYLAISNDIHLILSNCQDLTNSQKLDFCANQRYFMKLYLKKTLNQINQVC